MNADLTTLSRWSTAALADGPPATGAVDLPGLGEHLRVCRAQHSRLGSLHCLLESLHGFMASHVCTSALLLMLLVGCATLIT
jgi:hypothetical protein